MGLNLGLLNRSIQYQLPDSGGNFPVCKTETENPFSKLANERRRKMKGKRVTLHQGKCKNLTISGSFSSFIIRKTMIKRKLTSSGLAVYKKKKTFNSVNQP